MLDVAAGSGLLSRAISTRARSVVALDLTPEMLAEARHCAEREGLANIRFEEGAAESLPYAEAAFDLVVTRFSIHHFSDPQAAVLEMARVARPRGRVGLIDLVVPEEVEVARRANDLERLRDPTHTRALPASQLRGLLQSAGANIILEADRDVANEVLPWLDRTRTPATARQTILGSFQAELSGGTPTGMRPFYAGGKLHFLHRWQVAIGRIPADRLPPG